jgi:hypothetical protein
MNYISFPSVCYNYRNVATRDDRAEKNITRKKIMITQSVVKFRTSYVRITVGLEDLSIYKGGQIWYYVLRVVLMMRRAQ